MEQEYRPEGIKKRHLFGMGVLIATMVSIVVLMQSAPVCQHIQPAPEPKVSQKEGLTALMNKTRAGVVMEYQMPVIYIWIGKELPPRYRKRLEWITFPYTLLGEKEWEELGTDFHKYDLQPVQKADILRLLYLQKYAGVYSDFDNIIDYHCLMRMLARKRGFWMAGEPFVNWEPFASNLLLFVDRPNDPLLGTVITAIKEKIDTLKPEEIKSIFSVYQITGPGVLGRLGVQKMNDLYQCQDHERDSLWAK